MAFLALLGALEVEVQDLRRGLDQPEERALLEGRVRVSLGTRAGREVLVAALGVGELAARPAVEAIIRDFPIHSLISLGCCGALSPQLAPGHLAVADRVVRAGALEESYPCHRALVKEARRASKGASIPCHVGPMLTVARGIFAPEGRKAALERFGAISVEMESASLLEEAQRHSIPALAMRAVLDGCQDQIQHLGLTIAPNGRLRPLGLTEDPADPVAAVWSTPEMARRAGLIRRCLGDVLDRMDLG